MHDAGATAAVRDLVRPLLLIDLRIQCRARGLNPGGGRDTLADRLAEHMLETGDRDTNKPAGTAPPPVTAATATVTLEGGMASPAKHAHAHVAAPQTTQQAAQAGEGSPPAGNNYARPAGQNVGNFLTDRPSSRVLAPPGGGSQITFG